MNLREAAGQALDELIAADGMPICNETDILDLSKTIDALRAALADTQDWDEVEAMRASLREHMSEIHRLREAGRQALDAMDDLHRTGDTQVFDMCGREATEALRAALEPVTERHEKEGDKLSPPLDHVPDATKNYLNGYCVGRTDLLAEQAKAGTVEPVAWRFYDGKIWCYVNHISDLSASTKFEPLYTAPPKREPLTIGHLFDLYNEHSKHQEEDWLVSGWLAFAAAIQRAHDRGGEE